MRETRASPPTEDGKQNPFRAAGQMIQTKNKVRGQGEGHAKRQRKDNQKQWQGTTRRTNTQSREKSWTKRDGEVSITNLPTVPDLQLSNSIGLLDFGGR
mmetsp:Transcript_49298/g.104881  ORF Transcript_49298/g.104881 Transcript_49298/m.104881 type:complete len:99 (-) Transcript_49298:1-297(-)